MQVTGECVTVDVPQQPFGIYEMTLDPADPPENGWIANRPIIDWNWPAVAVAGEPLRLIGRCLADVSKYRTTDSADPVSFGGLRPRQTRLVARRVGDTRFKPLPVDKSSAYEIHAQWPSDWKPGKYEVFAHNGRGGKAGWSSPLRVTAAASATLARGTRPCRRSDSTSSA